MQFSITNLKPSSKEIQIIRSIKTNLPYLFTFQDYPELKIPSTTNSADGSFGHRKDKVRLHRHLSIERKEQLIDRLLESNSS